ncbi:MAG: carboxymuconolactone decarboxylase family protein [Dehalococcoidia bacterium]
MPRLRQVSKSEASEDIQQVYQRLFGDRDPVKEPGTATGTPGNWWTVFAVVPEILEHAQRGFALFSSRRRKLSPQLRELGLMRTGFAAGSQFVFSQHCKAARSAGLSEDKVAAITSWSTADVYSADERAVLAYTDAVVLQDGRVSDQTFAALKQHLDDESILELTYAVATYRLHATMCRALRLEYDDVDERVIEIAAPAGQQSADVMSQISR